jgi:hypothetical protein
VLSLEIKDTDGRWLGEAAALYDDEVLDYLAALPGFPGLEALCRLDRDGETLLAPSLCEALAADLAEIAPRVRRRDLPEPPAWVGLEGTGDIRLGDELGWPGLADLLGRTSRLLALARRPGMELWALGDD